MGCKSQPLVKEVSGARLKGRGRGDTSNYMDVEDFEVYKKLCRLHIEVCDLTHKWPKEEKYELGAKPGTPQTAHPLNSPRKMITGISVTKSKA